MAVNRREFLTSMSAAAFGLALPGLIAWVALLLMCCLGMSDPAWLQVGSFASVAVFGLMAVVLGTRARKKNKTGARLAIWLGASAITILGLLCVLPSLY